MKPKTNLCLALLTLLVLAGSALAFRKATLPVYLYLHNPVTGKCDIRDSTFYYTAVDSGTPGATPLLGNLGNFDGAGNCDTVYVVISE